jgi:hypothetical protein
MPALASCRDCTDDRESLIEPATLPDRQAYEACSKGIDHRTASADAAPRGQGLHQRY